ncbi:MAG TPA: alpha/beta hydrolase [Thermotogota bacterium]|nr:alpha/beta hydrolase [Thermotogota bacterium]
MKRQMILMMIIIILSVSAALCTNLVQPHAFEQFEFTIGTQYIIPAALTIPKDRDSFPLVVIVQGSGDSGIDNLVGENATIKDIAHGLSDKGIATFRYAKRNGLYPEQFKLFTSETVEKEYMEDALIAMDSALRIPGVESVYLLGVSMGGYLLPEIADRIEERFSLSIEGLILCASGIGRTPAPLVMFQQIQSQMEAAGYTPEQIIAARQVWEDIAENRLSEQTIIHPTMTAGYVYRIMVSDPYSRLKKNSWDVLVLQGDADRINSARFFEEMREDLESSEQGTSRFHFELFEQINHRLMKKEYDDLYTDLVKKGTVDPQIIQTIVQWVHTHEEKKGEK